MEPVTDRLKALRNRAVPKVTVRGMAAALDMRPSTYAAYEDRAKFKKPIIPLDLAKKIASILAGHGIPEADVLELAGVTGAFRSLMADASNPDPEDEWLNVTGSVVAGVWRAEAEWPVSEQYSVRFGPSEHPKSHRFAVRMEGLSMNRTIQPGADLECLHLIYAPIAPMPGDLVIVQRKAHDLVEMTCKRLGMDGDELVLLCESYEPEFQEIIKVGRPDNGDYSDEEVRIIGIVLSAKQDLAPRHLSQRRIRKN